MKKIISLATAFLFLSCFGYQAWATRYGTRYSKKDYFSHAHYRLVTEEARLKQAVLSRQNSLLETKFKISNEEINLKYAKKHNKAELEHQTASVARIAREVEQLKAKYSITEEQMKKEKKQLSQVRSAIDKMEKAKRKEMEEANEKEPSHSRLR